MSSPDFPQTPALQFVPFREAHLMSLNIQDKHSQTISKTLPIMEMIKAQARHGDAFTAILHGNPVACFGSVRIWTGVEEMWLLMEERGREYAKALTRATPRSRPTFLTPYSLRYFAGF